MADLKDQGPSGLHPVVVGMLCAAIPLNIFLSFDLEGMAREIEGVISIGLGALLTGATLYFAKLTASTEDPLSAMLRAAQARGATDVDARALELTHEAQLRLNYMERVSADRAEPLRQAVADLHDKVKPLLEDILTNPEMRRRADNVLRRTLPRLAEAVGTYVDYAERGTDLVDPTEMRTRLIDALGKAADQAERARMDAMEGVESNVEIALNVLESSFDYDRR